MKWDGKDRISTILTEYLGVEQDVAITAIFKGFLIGAACAYPVYLPIKGDTGTGKTLFVKRLNEGAGRRVVEEYTLEEFAATPYFLRSGTAAIITTNVPQADAIAVGELNPTKDITDDACVADFEQLWAQVFEEIGG